MKNFSFAIIIAAAAISWFNFSATKKPPQNAAQKITQAYLEDFNLFRKEVTNLANLADSTDDRTLLRRQIAETRFAYKRIEFFFDYLLTHYNYLYINGAPLPKLDAETYDSIIPPNGLQTLDELIFSDEASSQLFEIKRLSVELQQALEAVAATHLQIRLSDQQVFEALRSGIVRVFSLGLSGFDTPGSGNAIPEAAVSMQGMEKAFLFYNKNLKPETRIVFQEIQNLFELAKHKLAANPSFDSFDRMAFLKQVINPLYGKLLDFQRLNTIPAAQYKNHAQDYNAVNLFSEDFLRTSYFSEFSFRPLSDPAAIELGKNLFYDPVLSKDMKMSCASCHDPAKAFTDGLPKSKTNHEGRFTSRNAPTLIDAGYTSRYFWDMREYNLERQVAHVVNDSLEFNIGFEEIADRLYQSDEYVEMFESLYGKTAKKVIYSRTISNAIAAYVNSLKSFDSEFDRFVRNELDSLPQAAVRGFNLFMGKAACGTCHFVPVFNGSVPPFYTDAESEVLGITMGFDTLNPKKDPDPGRLQNGLKKEAAPHFENAFKTVTVRNSALTAPYMHNGLFETLEDVMEFYNRGGGAGLGLDIENQTLSATPLNLSEKEKNDIIAFMHTLTDTTGLTNANVKLPRFEKRREWNERGY